MRFWGALKGFLDALGALLGDLGELWDIRDAPETPKRCPRSGQEASKSAQETLLEPTWLPQPSQNGAPNAKKAMLKSKSFLDSILMHLGLVCERCLGGLLKEKYMKIAKT